MHKGVSKTHYLVITIIVSVVLLPCSSQAMSKNDILQPIQDDLNQAKAAMQELDRQFDLRLQYLQDNLKLLNNLQNDVQQAELRLQQEFDARNKALDRAVLTAWQLINELDDVVHIPLFGAMRVEEMRALREKERLDMEKIVALVQSGDYFFQIPGRGQLSKNTLEDSIAQQQESINLLERQASQGTFIIFYPGLGHVDRSQLETHAAQLEERINTINKQIASGDYIIILPHLGPVTKNILNTRIEDLKGAIAQLQQNYSQGEQRISRPGKDWTTKKQLAGLRDELQEKKANLQKELKNNTISFLLPPGWSNAQTLKERIAALRESTSEIEATLHDKEYRVLLYDGTWANQAQLDKALINAVIAPDIRHALQKGLQNITHSAILEKELYSLEAAKLELWLNEFQSIAAPHFALLNFQLNWTDALLKEYRRDEETALRRMHQELRWLERCKRYLP